MPPSPTSPRPRRTDEPVVKAAVEALLPAVLDWLKQNGDDSSPEEVARDLRENVRFETDGYAIARELESDGWSPDEDLVDILSGFFGHQLQAHDAAVAAWLPTSGLTAPPLGSWWKCSRDPNPGHVVRINEIEGTVTLCVPALGHTPDPGPRGGTVGFIIPWEGLQPAETTNQATNQ